MNASSPPPLPEYTPEEMAALYAKHKAQFTAEDLHGYIEDDEPSRPAEEVLAAAKKLIEAKKAVRKGSA